MEESAETAPAGSNLHLRDISAQAGAVAAERWRNVGEAGQERKIVWRRFAGREWKIFAGDGLTEEHPHFSPDGRWLAYASNRSGATEVYLAQFPAGRTRRISTDGGTEPKFRNDGRELFYLSARGEIRSVDLTNNSEGAAATPLFSVAMQRGSEGPLFDVTRAGQRFVVIVSSPTQTADTMTMIVNWGQLLRQ